MTEDGYFDMDLFSLSSMKVIVQIFVGFLFEKRESLFVFISAFVAYVCMSVLGSSGFKLTLRVQVYSI